MKNEEILKKAVEKAGKNGFDLFFGMKPVFYDYKIVADEFAGSDGEEYSINDIIFSHEFAKAFWGEDFICKFCFIKEAGFPINHKKTKLCELQESPKWIIGLRLMVQEENPIKYLEKFL